MLIFDLLHSKPSQFISQTIFSGRHTLVELNEVSQARAGLACRYGGLPPNNCFPMLQVNRQILRYSHFDQ